MLCIRNIPRRFIDKSNRWFGSVIGPVFHRTTAHVSIYMLHGCTITCIDRKKQLQSCSWLFGALMFIHSQPKKNTTNSAAKYGTKSDSFVSAIEMCVCVLCAVHVCQKRAHWRTNEAVRAERLWHKTLSKERYTQRDTLALSHTQVNELFTKWTLYTHVCMLLSSECRLFHFQMLRMFT